MLTDDEEEGLRALLAQAPAIEDRLGTPALTHGDAEFLRVLRPHRAGLQGLLTEARSIGAPSLLRRLFVLMVEGTQNVTSAASFFVPVDSLPITMDDAPPHSFYLPSLFIHTDLGDGGTIATHQTGVHSVAALGTAGIHGGIVKYRSDTGDDTIEVALQLYNNSGADRDVEYKVYRIAGLT